MDTKQIYEEILFDECLSRLKARRDQWNRSQWYTPSSGTKSFIPEDLCAIDKGDGSTYEFVMNGSSELVYGAIARVVLKLAAAYGLEAKPLPISREDAYLYRVGDADRTVPSVRAGRHMALAFLLTENEQKYLYIFKRFGVGEYLPRNLTNTLANQTGATEVRYVSLVERDAYSDILNHNEDENDPTRGTGTYSIKQFFEVHFSKEEYLRFKAYLDILKKRALDYFGLSVVKTLSPNSFHYFRREVRTAISEFNYSSADPQKRLSSSQQALINEQFFDGGMCEALTGSNDFAKSFMTAEWLYHSLRGAQNFDLTSITMGYFKAVEQFLYDFVCMHTMDRDDNVRRIYAGKYGIIEIASKQALDQVKESVFLSGLTGFFGFRKDDGYLQWRNKDLLRSAIDDDTYGLIVDTLQGITEIRNGYFHKDNSYSWNTVEDARNKTLFALYLVLGAYRYSDEDEGCLGVTHAYDYDDFYTLCEYINSIASSVDNPLEIPVFYLDGNHEDSSALLACTDPNIEEYDKYGNPCYTGAYFKHVGQKAHHEFAYIAANQPKLVEQGLLRISSTVPIQLELTQPEKTVFKNGQFLLIKA